MGNCISTTTDGTTYNVRVVLGETIASANAYGRQGDTGANGTTPTISVGNVTTGSPGTSASVTNTGNLTAAVFDFTIPRGETGAAGSNGTNGSNGSNGINGANGVNGTAATITVGTVTTGAAGTNATITNVGNTSVAIFDFAIPRGATGADGGNYTLPNATASVLGGIKVGANLTIANGVLSANNTGGNSTYDNYGIYNVVRDYGAVQSTSTDSSAAIQSACDAAKAAGGGTVYFPSTGLTSNRYKLGKPVWVGSKVKLRGHSKESTGISALWNPAFVIADHPTKWNVRNASYTNTDGGGTVYTTTAGAAYPGTPGDWICDGKVRQDLNAFWSSPTVSPSYTSGNLPSFPFFLNDWKVGLRTRGYCHLRSPGNPMATGGKQGWHNTRALTVSALVYSHSSQIIGGIGGAGSAVLSQWPDPWLLHCDATNINFDLMMTDDGLVEQQWLRVTAANPSGAGYRRIVVQIDLDAASGDQVRVFVDRVRVAHTLNYMGGSGLVSASGAALTTHNRIAPWRWGDFHMGSVYADTSKNGVDAYVSVSDYTIIGLAVWTTALFSAATSVGGYQTLTAAGTSTTTGIGKSVDYSTSATWPTNSWDDISLPVDYTRLNALGVLNTEVATSPAGTVDYWFSVRGTGTGMDYWTGGGGNGNCWGFICPDGSSHATISEPEISDMTITGSGGSWQVSTGLVIGKSLDGRMDRVRVTDGCYNSVGMTKDMVSYTWVMSDCDLLSGGAALINIMGMWASVTNLAVGYSFARHIVNVGGVFECPSTKIVPTPEPTWLAYYCFYAIGSTSAKTTIRDLIIDIENNQFNPKLATFYIEKDTASTPTHVFSGLTVPDSVAPTFLLYDRLSSQDHKWTQKIIVEDSWLPHTSTICSVYGDDWTGGIEVRRTSAADDVVEAASNSGWYDCTEPGYRKVKTTHKDAYAPLPTGGWVKDCHELYPINPAEGGVVRWGIKTTGVEGSDTPPVWFPEVLKYGNRKNVIGGHCFPTLYVKSTAPRPTSSTTALWSGHMSEYWSDLILSHIFGGVSAPTMTHVSANYGYAGYYPTSSSIPSPSATSGSLSNNGSLWGSSSGGTKSSVANVTMTTTAFSTLTGYPTRTMFRGRAYFALNLGAASPGYAAFFGRTTKVAGSFFSDGPWDIASGNLQIKQSAREGSFTTVFLDTVANWMFGGGSFTPPSNFYFGLSTTAVAADGTGATEPSGGSYARTSAKARGSTDWQRMRDQKGLWTLKTNATFPSPTGSWGDCIWWTLHDASTSGNLIASGPLHVPISPVSGQAAPIIYPGALTFGL